MSANTRSGAASISHLIVNRPYEEPNRYWQFDYIAKGFELSPGRRPAGFVRANPSDPDSLFDDPGEFVSIELVNTIRPLVQTWRESGYTNASPVTRLLLEFWRDKGARELPFFFCQIEAIETLIWMVESPPANRTGLKIQGDGSEFERVCSKMATGSGKTVVMAMLIAWHVLNKIEHPSDSRFTKHVLVIAPGLTVKSRLNVLDPLAPGNAYEEFRIVPNSKLPSMRQGKVTVLNWHSLSPLDPGKGPRVMKLGRERDPAFARRCIGELADAPKLLVINDEAHHAWRNTALTGLEKIEREKATVWVQALDRLNNSVGILRCHDFSATPFVPGKQSASDTVFPWIVSDFSLTDAIESGLVKTPRIVISDDAGIDPATGRSRLSHIYGDPDVKIDFSRRGVAPSSGLPPLVTMAYIALGSDWTKTAEQWRKAGVPTKPVMITVANSIETSMRIEHAFRSNHIPIPELCEPSAILRIDSKMLESEEDVNFSSFNDEATSEVIGSDDDTGFEDKKRAFAEQYSSVRRLVDSVGQPGKPGARLHNIISVSMLSEGWDARTVTHIMGLRAFTSQLLCEQVVGRGLRRTNYEPDKDGYLSPEYVNVFGVPFSFLPVEGAPNSAIPSTPSTAIFVDPSKSDFEIHWPRVNAVVSRFNESLTLDIGQLPELTIDGSSVTLALELGEPIDGRVDVSRLSRIELEEWARRVRLQPVLFNIARSLFQRMPKDWSQGREYLIGDVIGFVDEFIASGKLRIQPQNCEQDSVRRRLTLTVRARSIVEHLWSGLRLQNTVRRELRLDEVPVGSTSQMKVWYTRRPTCPSNRSHVNVCVYDKSWERQAAELIDGSDLVQSWTKNDHLDFEINYLFEGVSRRYRPDFIIRFKDGATLILEVKGIRSAESDAKHLHLEEWVFAVNEDGRFGQWLSAIAYAPVEVATVLSRHGKMR